MNKQIKNRLIDIENILPDGGMLGEMGGKSEDIKKYKLVITEESWGC